MLTRPSRRAEPWRTGRPGQRRSAGGGSRGRSTDHPGQVPGGEDPPAGEGPVRLAVEPVGIELGEVLATDDRVLSAPAIAADDPAALRRADPLEEAHSATRSCRSRRPARAWSS